MNSLQTLFEDAEYFCLKLRILNTIFDNFDQESSFRGYRYIFKYSKGKVQGHLVKVKVTETK